MVKSIVAYFGDKLATRRSPPMREIASARGTLASVLGSIAPYNPDDLIGKRGYAVYDQMQKDAHVQACLTIKKLSVLSHGWEVHPASDEPDEEAERLAEMSEEEVESLLAEKFKELL